MKKALLISGILSSILYISTDLVASSVYNGYIISDQNYSELLATGAPTRSLMLLVSAVYNLLVSAFAIGIWTTASPNRTARITGALMVGYAILSMVTPAFFQMDMRGTEITSSGSLHPPMTALMSIFILLSIGFGAFLLNKRFCLYSFITIIILLIFGGLTASQAPKLVTGQPTPWMGFTERINIYATMLWFALLSIALQRNEKMKGEVLNKFV